MSFALTFLSAVGLLAVAYAIHQSLFKTGWFR
jgi:hypothetical protein